MDTKTISNKLGRTIMNELQMQSKTKSQLCLNTGIPRTTLDRKLLSGVFDIEQVVKIADFLGFTPSELFKQMGA